MAIILSDNTPRIEYDVAQGVTRTDPYPIPFAFFNKETDNCDVKVFVDGVERTLGSSSTTQFSILSGGNGAKGSLSTVVTGASGGSTVIVLRDTKIGRITDFPSGGAFEVSKLNTELDTLVAIEGDFEDHVSRSIRLQDKDTAVSLALPLKADRLGKQLGFHATTGAVQMFTPESLAIASDSGSSSVDLTSHTFTFTGGEGIDTSISNQTLTITGELASTSNKGVASFNSTNFTVSSGAVTAKDITFASDSGSATNTLGETFTLSGGTGLTTSATGSTVTMNVDAVQTGITSLLATDIKIGEDDQTKIDFETADQINFYANNVNVVQLSNANSGDAVFTVPTSDKDFVIKGNDGGSPITALSIDMSDAGSAIFNNDVSVNGDLTVTGTTTTVNSTTVNIADHNIVLDSDNSTSAVINGAGITIEGGSGDDATFTYNTIGPKFELKLGSSYEDLQVDNLIAAQLTGTIQTATQPNITSLGTLTGLTTSGTITLSGTTSPFIKTTGFHATADRTILQVNTQSTQIGEFGFDIKYMGSRSGNNNSYSLFMHNQTGTDVEAMTVFQDGKVGINQTTPTASLHVGDTALFDGDVTFTGANYNVVWDKSADALEFLDNAKAVFGTGDDGYIRHTGSNLQIIEQTGGIQISNYANDSDVDIRTDDGSGSVALYFKADGSTGDALLYHYGSEKLKTQSGGVTVTGDLTASENLLTTDGSVFTVRNDQRSTGSSSTAGELNVSNSTIDSKAMFCHSLVSVNPNDARYAKIAELPASDTQKQDHITITGRVGGWLDSNSLEFELTFHNRNAFAFDLHYKDNSAISTIGGIKSYLQSDGTIDIYFFAAASSYSILTYTIPHSHQATIVEDPVFTASTPSGTENFDSTDPDTYTPALKFPDKQQLSFGTGDDLIIHHNGSHSFIKEQGTGNLKIQATSLSIESGAGEEFITATADGAVELYHDNSKKLETTSDGATVTGDLTATSSDGAILSLQTSDTTVADGDTIGLIEFKAPSEGSGTDAILTAASIVAEADATFAADNNQTDMVFNLGSSEAATEKMRLSHEGILTVDDGVVGKHFGGISESSVSKFRYWNSSTQYVSGFKGSYTFGGLGDSGGDGYAFNWTNSNNDHRGFIWDDNGHSDSQGAMALTTNGKLTVAHSIRVGHGESDTTTPGATHVLDVGGSGIINGDLTLSSTDAGSGDNPTLTLKRDSSSPAAFDNQGTIKFLGENSASEEIGYGQIQVQASTVTDGSEESRMTFSVFNDGAHKEMLMLDAHQGGGVVYLTAGIDLMFEGTNSNGNETTVTVTDPTADRTITLPDATGTVMLQDSNGDSTINGALTVTGGDSGDVLLTFLTDRSWQFQQTGDDGSTSLSLKANVDGKFFNILNSNSDADFAFFTSHSSSTPFLYIGEDAQIRFEGATANDHEIILTVTDPTADRTITLPDATGDVVLNESGTVNITTTDTSGVDNPNLVLNRIDTSPTDFANIGAIDFKSTNSNSEQLEFASISGMTDDITDGTEDGRIRFSVLRNGTNIDLVDFDPGGITLRGGGATTTAGYLQFYQSGGGLRLQQNSATPTSGQTRVVTFPDASGTVALKSLYFQAFRSTNSASLTSTFATIDFDTVTLNSDNSILVESGGEVTINKTSVFRFHADVTTKITSGSSRSDCEIELQKKASGGSYSVVVGTTAMTYNRIESLGQGTASIDFLISVTSGDTFKVVVKRQGGTDTIVVEENAARFNIQEIN
ncbi:MAG: hypothetical protein Tp125DCM114561_40 [Prokaryotic dsDNA virus sp.]|nr:MAG: hypothetical protein Tp125DCM114561_40 [Prokaryotic dsDNA virus sp.]